MNQLTTFSNKARTILRTDGVIALLKAIWLFLISPVYSHNIWFLSTREMRIHSNLNEADYRPNIDNLVFKVISSSQQADELEKEGFSFREYPTDFNHGLRLYTDWLDKGAIAFCAFADRELASVRWGIFAKRVQDAIKTYPVKINFDHEATFRGAWVNPKYRGQNLSKYFVYFFIEPWLVEHGITNTRGTMSPTNNAGLALQRVLGTAQYGKGHQYKILWWKFWREEYYDENKQKDNGNGQGQSN